jgi:hypothetical protein
MDHDGGRSGGEQFLKGAMEEKDMQLVQAQMRLADAHKAQVATSSPAPRSRGNQADSVQTDTLAGLPSSVCSDGRGLTVVVLHVGPDNVIIT